MPPAGPGPEEMYRSYEHEIDLLESAARTGAPTQDPASSFYALPQDDFIGKLLELRDEIEERAYLAIVAATEAAVQRDLRARKRARASVPLRDDARRLTRQERGGRRIVVEDVLDAWADWPGARQAPISEFKQLLHHRHWLAHGRYFDDHAGVPTGPDFAMARARAMLAELVRLDPEFPRGSMD